MNRRAEGENKKAAEVLAYLDKHIPSYNVPVSYMSGSFDEARAYAAIGNKQKAMELYKQLSAKSEQYVGWYCSLDGMRFQSSMRDCLTHIYILQQISLETDSIDKKWSDAQQKRLNALVKYYQSKGGSFGSSPAPDEDGEYDDEYTE